jgi:hypothetical protein
MQCPTGCTGDGTQINDYASTESRPREPRAVHTGTRAETLNQRVEHVDLAVPSNGHADIPVQVLRP